MRQYDAENSIPSSALARALLLHSSPFRISLRPKVNCSFEKFILSFHIIDIISPLIKNFPMNKFGQSYVDT